MKKNIPLVITLFLLTSGIYAQQKNPDFNTEIEKWKKELVLNGEVGNPCRLDNDWERWEEENPNVYFGLQEIQPMLSDFNSDGIMDGLFYFPAENCVGGNGFDSDFAMLVYSHKGEILTNMKITKILEQKIKNSLAELGIYDVYRIVLRYKGLGKTVVGNYISWSEDDAKCCPSFEGTFEYNPIDFSLIIQNRKK